MEINPDLSIGVNIGEGQRVLVDRVYDNVHIFKPLGHAILKLIGEEGFMQIHVSEEDGLAVAEGAGIKPLERDEISEKEYAAYLEFQEHTLKDDWLDS